MSPTAAPAAPPTRTRATAGFRELPITALVPSPLNPRKTFESVSLADLASSIMVDGVMEPLVVRPLPGDPHVFEVVAGERRFRASQMAGLTVLPCMVRDLTDAQVIEHGLVENHQRADVHPLEEAEAIQQLMGFDTAYTPAGVALKLGVSSTWVYNRLKLLQLSDAARAAYRAGALTGDHADQLARVPEARQSAALEACFSQMLYQAPDTDDYDTPYSVDQAIEQGRWELLAPALVSASQLRKWIAAHSTVDITDQAVQDALPELVDALEDVAADAQKLIQLSTAFGLSSSEAKALGVVRAGKWTEIDEDGKVNGGNHSTKRCEFMKPAVITHPADRPARVITACLKPSCPVHRPKHDDHGTTGGPRQTKEEITAAQARIDQERAERQAAAHRWETEERPKYLAALMARVAAAKVTPALVREREIVEPWKLDRVLELYGLTLTAKTALTVLLLAQGPGEDWELEHPSHQLDAFGAAFGLTPAQWLKSQKPAKPAAKKAPTPKSKPAKATKKTATKKKGGR